MLVEQGIWLWVTENGCAYTTFSSELRPSVILFGADIKLAGNVSLMACLPG